MTARSNDILLVHPGKQHAYEVAVALQEHGRLLRFVTGIYDAPSSWLISVTHVVSRVCMRDQIERQLSKRRHPAIEPRLVVSWPAAELVSRTVGHVRLVQRLTRGRSGYLLANWCHDRAVARALRAGRWQPRAVYGFLGAARYTFAACRELGIRTILDVPIVLSASYTMAKERRMLGITRGQPTISTLHLSTELRNADQVIAPSPAVAESVRASGYSGPISEVAFGAALDCFRPSAVRRERFRVVYAGRIELRKGLHYLVRGWNDAAVQGELVIAGSPGEAEYVDRVRAEYGDSIMEAGNLTRDELAQLLGTADVFVMPSLAEGSALVTYEALAAGLPSIVTHESGSVVRDGIEGFVVPAGDSAALATCIRELHGNPVLRARMSTAARARAEEFSWPAYRRRLIAAIDSGVVSEYATA